MRGKGVSQVLAAEPLGITPAYAGKRLDLLNILATAWDHPRVRGEKPCCNVNPVGSTGSPPRMRGKGWTWDAEAGEYGITPAYAGKRRASGPPPGPARDHPRVCGEKLIWACCADHALGSPPRMRGKGRAWSERERSPGITPAYAGKSLSLRSVFARFRDHPRVCGEKISSELIIGARVGSPPRMRGKGGALWIEHKGPGITPAYAGKSSHRVLQQW